MATKKTQRWAILIIMIVMVVGTLGSFAVMILNQKSQAEVTANYQKALATYTKEYKAHQAKVDAQADELSSTYYETFKQYSSKVASFDIDSVTELSTEDLVVGSGEEITGTTGFAAYYIGWDANANIFDQSIDTTNNKLKAPLSVSTGLDAASLIDGWKEGMKGMHIGGVRLITIPSDKAYGSAGSTDSSGNQTIAANMPLKFVVMAIPSPEEIAESDAYTKAANEYYQAMSKYYAAQ